MDILKPNKETLKIKSKLGSVSVKNSEVTIERIDGTSKAIVGPGEYEVAGISIFGFVDANQSPIYVIETEGLNVCLVENENAEISEKLVDEIGSVDILCTNNYKIELVEKLDPYFVIATNAPESADLPIEKMTKFSLKKSEIIDDQSTKVIVLESK